MVTMHHDYRTMGGQPRPMDSHHNVPGDTPCECGGIAWYHDAAGNCDDCDCHEYWPVFEDAAR